MLAIVRPRIFETYRFTFSRTKEGQAENVFRFRLHRRRRRIGRVRTGESWPRGKTLGGSSSINGLIYIRGQREDYDHWAALGNPGWGYDDLLPYFKRSPKHNQRGASAARQRRAAAGVGHRRARADRSLHRRRRPAGVPRNDDFNGATQEGAGYYQLTTWKGWRCSTAKGLPGAGEGRPNLDIADRGAGDRITLHQAGAPSACTIVQGGTTTQRRALPRRGAAVCRRDPVAAAAAALGHRPRGAAAAAWHAGGA
jgi:choline dehydrogenase-like flavoprotein